MIVVKRFFCNVTFTHDFPKHGEIFKCKTVFESTIGVSPHFLIAEEKAVACFIYIIKINFLSGVMFIEGGPG